MPDIETRDDIERLVRAFYGKAMRDDMIGFIFTDVAKLDLEAHAPRITSFWETVLLGNRTYFGSPFDQHVPLHARVGLKHGQFERWLVLWFGTVDELFAGERANQAKVHALRVAQAFHKRLEGFPSPADARPHDTLVVTRHGPGSRWSARARTSTSSGTPSATKAGHIPGYVALAGCRRPKSPRTAPRSPACTSRRSACA